MSFRWEYVRLSGASCWPGGLALGAVTVTFSGLLAARGHLCQEEREVQGEGDAPETAELRERWHPGK